MKVNTVFMSLTEKYWEKLCFTLGWGKTGKQGLNSEEFN